MTDPLHGGVAEPRNAHGEYRMYRILRIAALAALLISGLVRPTWGGLAEDQYAIAAHHYSQQRWEFAVAEFTEFLERYPDHDRAENVRFFLAESLIQLRRYQDAHQRFAEYVRNSPEGKYHQQCLFRLGETLYLDRQHQQARQYLERFAREHGEDSLCGYALPYLGEIHLAAGDADAAHEAFEQGLQQFPSGPLADECRFGLARALEAQGDPDGAMRFYRYLGESEQRTSVTEDALLRMGILLYQQERFDEAVEVVGRHRERYPGSELAAHAAYWLGLSQLSAGQLRPAADTLTAAATRFRSHELAPAVMFSAGEAYRRLDEPAAACNYYELVVAEYADSEWVDDSLDALVQLAWRDGDYPRVRRLADSFVQRAATSPLLVRVQQTAARACLKEGVYDEARSRLAPLLVPSAAEELGSSLHAQQPHVAPLPSEIVAREPDRLAATRYYLALALLGLELPAAALEQLDFLTDLEAPPELAAGVHAARAAALLSLDRPEQAIESLHLYLTRQPDGPDAEKCRAQLLVSCVKLERWSEALRVLHTLPSVPADLQLHLSSVAFVAEAAYDKGQHALAEQAFRELAKEGYPERYAAQGLSGLAWLDWQREGGAAQSAQQFEQLLNRYPDSPLAAEAAMMRGRALEQVDRSEGALAMYRLVYQQYGDSQHAESAILAAARIHDALQQDREAETLLRQWLEQQPNTSPQRPAALYQLAWVLVDLERQQEADDLFREIHRQYPDSQYWADATYRLAERAAREQQYADADTLATSLLARSKEPQMATAALYLRGQLAAAQQRWPDVLARFQTLLEEHPSTDYRLPAQYWLAESHYRLRQYQEAGERFDTLDTQTRDRQEDWVAMIPLRRAQVRAHQRQWAEAHDIVVQIKERFPQFDQMHEVDYLVGRYHASRAELDAAREAYLRVIASATGRGTETAAVAQWMIGETYFMQKQYRQAIQAYHRVEALHDYPRWQAAALLQAGKCHEMLDQWPEAIELYSRAATHYADTPFGAKAAERLRVAQQKTESLSTR